MTFGPQKTQLIAKLDNYFAQKKRQGFRLVPVENHVKFEKVKTGSRKEKLNAAETKAQKDKQISEKLTEVLQKKNLATVAPKKENILSRLRNTIKKSIA